MKILIGIPTLSRADLLIRNKAFLESVGAPDEVLIVDNGNQKIDISVPIERPGRNLGVSGSWNHFLRRAFVDGNFDGLALLNDDIIWDPDRLEAAKRLLAEKTDVSLFLSHLQFSVQVHRPLNLWSVGFFDEQFHPAYCEDDDYAIRMTAARRIYERFHELDPLPGSVIEGTKKEIPWKEQNKKLLAKWGQKAVGINIPGAAWYLSNRALL